MTEHFNPQKVLETALKVKESSKKLYEALSLKSAENQKRLWNYLSQDSELHGKVFKEMFQDGEAYVVYELSSGEYDPYLGEIIPSFRHTQETIVKKTRELFTSDLEAVEFALSVTIESILVYSALKNYIVPDKLDIFNKIIGDEKKHLAKLNLVKKDLMGKTG